MICPHCGQARIQKSNQTYTDNNLIRNRVITLENIDVKECPCGIVPVYLELAKLLELIKRRRDVNRFVWKEQDARWEPWSRSSVTSVN